MTNRTLNRHVSALSCVFKWADKRGHFDGRNPFQGQSRKNADGTGWRAYTIKELKTLFAGPLFGDVPTNERISPSQHSTETALYWAMLIALFSGMRQGEICQLRTDDIQRRGNVWVFTVTGDGAGQSLKTNAAARVVPVHSALIRCGLTELSEIVAYGPIIPGS